MLCSNLNPTTSEQSCTSLNGFIIGFEWSWPRRHLFVFGVTVGLNHCLQITFKHMPCGCEQVFLDWFPFFVYTSLSTGYKPAQHANMLWHFACRTDSDALSPPQAGLADILYVFSTHPTRNVEICYVEFFIGKTEITLLHSLLMISTWVTLTDSTIDCVRGLWAFS